MKNTLLTVAAAAVLTLLVLVGLPGCKKETRYPEIQTLEAHAVSPSRAVFRGNIVSKGGPAISDYGFVYGTSSNIGDGQGTRISLGSDPAEGPFEKESGVLQLGGYPQVFVRSYLTNSEGTAYGSVVSLLMPQPSTGEIRPSSGKSGDLITLSGKFYISDPKQVQVTFSEVPARVVEASDSKIVVEVPTGISASHGTQISIRLILDGQRSLNYIFSIQANIKDYSPKNAAIGSAVTFLGDNLPDYWSSGLRVLFGSLAANLSSQTGRLTATVPAELTTVTSKISVVLNNVTTILPGEFTVKPPVVSSISPATAMLGTTLTVTGSDFPIMYSYSDRNPRAAFGDVTVYPSSVSGTSLSFQVPALPAGEYVFSITAGPNTVSSGKVRVVLPTISGLNKTSGYIGDEVLLNCNFPNNGTSYQVSFGAISAYGQMIDNNRMRVYVPSGLLAGKVKLAVHYGSQLIPVDEQFTVLSPTITSFSPTSGLPGTVVTIYGTGFSPVTYNNLVRFGGVQSVVYAASPNTLQVQVPSGISPGQVKISVVNGMAVSSDETFTIR
ncbi:hypothetical protein C7T94_18805 [Pedobacter yulinensis]|uniref:IPT/TIG domain-containing protein n=1 Tax=Pedobacter yulinensis TaxID=2126353 RepID=A0A2T3HGU6_9SPHI|nr:IPT/TIG domain-containing protein [Pedobacter yulinensis]PST81665.1 hypothetical protein C7T94_18805 [Pedobacter yulinensis]